MKKQETNKILIVLMLLVLITSNIYSSEKVKADSNIHYTEDSEEVVDYPIINIANRTQNEIRKYIKKSGAKTGDKVTYKTNPVVKPPYKPGKLSDKTLDSAVKMVNQIRFIAGLDYNVKIDNDYTEKTQAASLVNSVNNTLTHYPIKPAKMQEKLFKLGADGARSSNIAMGYGTINSALLYGYMNDGGPSNIDRVGHRRWILNPEMSATGFGQVGSYSAMYAFDRNNIAADEYGVLWPAQNMPTEYFGSNHPWSISMGHVVEKNNIKISLIRKRDKKKWTFTSKKADGFFNVDNGGYGQKGCIIFRPEDFGEYLANDVFTVTVTGLSKPLTYEVNFFDLIIPKSLKVGNKSNVVRKGKHINLNVKTSPAKVTSYNYKWKSSNPKIAKVSAKGRVSGIKKGTATITITHVGSGIKTNYKVKVK